MVGTLESQFLKMQAQVKGARRCLDIGTFTGMSAIALAEGTPADGKVSMEGAGELMRYRASGMRATPRRGRPAREPGAGRSASGCCGYDGRG